MASYAELKTLTSQGIGAKPLPEAAAFLDQEGLSECEPTPRIDNQLLAASELSEDQRPLLCLRCHISHPMEAWIRALYGRFKTSYELELSALAGFALDDTGHSQVRNPGGISVPFSFSKIKALPAGLLSPFSAEVLRTYEHERCGLPHWARLKLQCHNELKTYLRQEGLLLISDWALLADTSQRRIRDSWQTCGDGAYTSEQQLELHRAYKPLYRDAMEAYRARTGKGSGWLPDEAFLNQLAPAQPLSETELQLKAMADGVRRLLSGRWMQSRSSDQATLEDHVDPNSVVDPNEAQEGDDPVELRQQIDQALHQALDAAMPEDMAAEARKFSKAPERKLAWQLYGEGLSQRDIAARCDHKQAWVSKLLDEKRRSTTIATAAALELKRRPSFRKLMTSVKGTERLLDALRNHLIEPEREGGDAPLRYWVLQYIQQS